MVDVAEKHWRNREPQRVRPGPTMHASDFPTRGSDASHDPYQLVNRPGIAHHGRGSGHRYVTFRNQLGLLVLSMALKPCTFSVHNYCPALIV